MRCGFSIVTEATCGVKEVSYTWFWGTHENTVSQVENMTLVSSLSHHTADKQTSASSVSQFIDMKGWQRAIHTFIENSDSNKCLLSRSTLH